MNTATTCREIPILFTGPMVRAILEGRKTQTRRIINPQPVKSPVRTYKWKWTPTKNEFPSCSWNGKVDINCPHCSIWTKHCPYGTVGDRLWVREAWAHTIVGNQIDYLYRADHHTGIEKKNGDQKWKPSIHMPKVACRLILEVTSVRVERVQEISEADAIAEGCIKLPASGRITDTKGGQYGGRVWTTAREWYSELWNKINGPDSWTSNPFVWVIEFRRLN